MSSLSRAGRRIRSTLSREQKPLTGKVIPIASPFASLYAEMETDADGKRLTIPKLGDHVISGIYKRRDRIAPEDLERAYRMDELVFGIINKYITVILGTGFVIIAKDPKSKQVMEDWCRAVKLNSALREVIRDLFVFGFSFVEKIFNVGKDKIVRLGTVDTKTLDFQRDANGNIIVDKWGLPIGFEQSAWVWKEGKTDTSAPGATGPGKQDIEITREHIAFFRLFTTSGAVIGISPLECLYNIITWRKNVDWAMGEGAFTYAAPPIIVNVGDKDVPIPQDTIDGIATDITNIGSQAVFVFPWHVKVDRLEASRGMDELANFAEHFKIAICNALMIPPPLMGVGGRISSSRALSDLAVEWERTVEGLQNMLAEQIEDQLFYHVAKLLDLKEVPQISWKSVSPSVALSRARRRGQYYRSGALTWDLQAENQIREEEGLPTLPEGYVPVKKNNLEDVLKQMIDDYLETKEEPEEDEGEEDSGEEQDR